MIRYFLVLLILCSISGLLNAQYGLEKGYIVTNQGDTLNGFIRIDKVSQLNQRVEFALKAGDSLKAFLPNDLKSFWIFPNLYFESHKVLSKIPNSYMTPQRLFLLRIQKGYVSVFKVEKKIGNAFFIKKADEDRISALYMCVKAVTDDNFQKRTIDTVTEFNIDDYRGRYYFRKDYIDTLKGFFRDWEGYKSYNFNLTELDIVSQVAAYNKEVHKQDFTKEEYKVRPSNLLHTVTIRLISPLFPRQDILRYANEPNDIIQSTLKTPFIGGGELSWGLISQGKHIGLGADLGVGYISKGKLSYTINNASKDTISKEALAYSYVFIEGKTLLKIAKLSPFLGVKVSFLPSNLKSPILDYQIGCQYQLNYKSTLKMQFDIQSFLVLPRIYTVFCGVGYQYFFRNSFN